MNRIALALAALLATSVANAQIYQWKDENGKTVISDKPPVGGTARSSRKIEGEAPPAKPVPQKSIADREMDFRKRQQEAQEKTDKEQKEQAAAADKKENCERARRYLQSLESGDSIATYDDKGERIFMEDAQRQQEIAKAKQAMQASCN